MLIGQARQLEEFQWFVRAHRESADGTLSTIGTAKERTAAGRATKKAKAR
jgi:starvation-inducible DNA-binding protein